jgi:nucleoid-associated protein YgaU
MSRWTMGLWAALLTVAMVVGCASSPAGTEAELPLRRDVLDVRRARPVDVAPALASVVAMSDRVPVHAPATRTHTVRRGETLFAIAKTSYGDGSQWKRLAAANPALAAGPLRVGQQIVVP